MGISINDCKVERIEGASLQLVNKFYKSCRYSAKAGRGDRVFCVKSKTTIVAALKLVPQEIQFADTTQHWLFLRSMCVDPSLRSCGIGSLLLKNIADEITATASYCFPFTHLEGFYASIGFVLRDPSDLTIPSQIRQSYARLVSQGRKVHLMTCL